ncbi:hypothetical protein J6590_093059 [Homalodisca vitripennis]|nr:hypothetical protein J6590_093059 [Homalodisca vitripennis]
MKTIVEVKTSLGALSVLVEGKILGSRHRHANDTNLHEKTWPRTTNLHEKVSLAVLKLSRRSMKTDCENHVPEVLNVLLHHHTVVQEVGQVLRSYGDAGDSEGGDRGREPRSRTSQLTLSGIGKGARCCHCHHETVCGTKVEDYWIDNKICPLNKEVARTYDLIRGKGRRAVPASSLRKSLAFEPLCQSYDGVQLQFTFHLVQRLKSNTVTDLTPGIWNQHPSEEAQNKSSKLHRFDI